MSFIKHAIYVIDLITAFYVTFQLFAVATANFTGGVETSNTTMNFEWWITLFVTRIFIIVVQNEYNKNK